MNFTNLTPYKIDLYFSILSYNKMSFHIGQNVYLLNDIQILTIIKNLGNQNYLVNTQDNLQIQVSKSQITHDKGLVIQTLLSKYSKLDKDFQILKQDYSDSREAWWILKDETAHYKKLLQKTNINSFKHY